jgi:hypothetical protein
LQDRRRLILKNIPELELVRWSFKEGINIEIAISIYKNAFCITPVCVRYYFHSEGVVQTLQFSSNGIELMIGDRPVS